MPFGKNYRPCALTGNKTQATPKDSSARVGSEQYKDDVVEVRCGVALTKDGAATSYKDAISLRLNCPEGPHIFQFIYREILGVDGQPKRRRVKTAAGAYDTTTNAAQPVWNTDSAAKPEPYYEASGASQAGPGWLTVYDQPTVTPGEDETWRATFKAYLICDGEVLREVMWMRSQGVRPVAKVLGHRDED